MNSYSDVKSEIGSRIKEIRLKRKITQEVLAEKVGISNPQQMSNIERGYSGISVKKLMNICSVLDIESDYILFGHSVKESELLFQKYTEKMSSEQIESLMEIVKAYAKVCGIDDK